VHVVADRIGTHRLYVNVSEEFVTVTDHLLDQARYQRAPRFDTVGTNVLLTLDYCLDPTSVLANTPVVVLGRIATCSTGKCVVARYHQPVGDLIEPYQDLDECLEAIDGALRSSIGALITDSVPLVMVSGGIDSLLLMKYVGELTGGQFESMTFAVEGSKRNELLEGSMAARHFGSKHHELIVPAGRVLEYATRALVECDVIGYGGVELIALADYFKQDGRPLTVFRGEDTRLHTPPVDGPTQLAIRAHLLGVPQRPLLRSVWELRRLLSRWPFQRGSNYAKHILAKTDLGSDIESYIVRSLLRFRDPTGSGVPQPIAERLSVLAPYTSMERIIRAAIIIAYDLQYTDDMHAIHSAMGDGRANLVMPFYMPNVVDAMARVPFDIANRRKVVSPSRTRSPFPFVDKYILRALMRGSAPSELLYRRKSTAPAMDVQIPVVYPNLVIPALECWGEHLVEALPEPSRSITQVYCGETLAGGVVGSTEYGSGVMGLRLLYLSALAWQMESPRGDLASALADLRPKA
jgi:hypothetical protein